MKELLGPEVLSQVLKVSALSALSFVAAIAVTPIFTHFAYKHEFWKKMRSAAWIGKNEAAPVYASLHKEKHARNIPTGAGIIIWGVVLVVTLVFNLNRSQTWLPLFTIVAVGILGFIDDIINTRSNGGVAGMRSRIKMLWLITIGVIGSFWFFFKLDYNAIFVPILGNVTIEWLYIPLFVFVFISSANAVNITDGLDGLSGGLLASSFFAFLVLAFFQGNYGIAAFCGTILGAVLAYTWFNIYPARFFMGDTGAVSLGATLGVIAMLTNSALVLPLIGLIFVVETLSVILQLVSKKLRNGKKIFLSSPLHHHLEATGWPETKVTMRFWVIGAISAVIGVLFRLLGN